MATETSATTANPFTRQARPHGLQRLFPGLVILRNYRRAWLIKDLTAGLVLTAILVPVGMGYAEAAGLPAIYGLYATITALIAYAIFGPSRVMVLGPDSGLAALIAATILPLANGDGRRAIALAGMLSILTGIVCILGGLARFGFVTDLLSKPIRYGYLNGIALTVVVSQLPKLLGFSAGGDSLIEEIGNIAQGVAAGRTNGTALAIGVASLAVILAFKRWAPKIPGVLIAVIGATLVVAQFDLAEQTGLRVVGALPQGLPAFTFPAVSMDDVRTLLAGALAIALVSFADMGVLSRTFALRGGYEVDDDQEFVALGAANIAAGLFQGFPISSSASRTPVAESAGAKTQLTGVVGAVCIALLLILAPTLLTNLPAAALGAVVIAACLGLVDVTGILRIYALRRSEFALSIICFLGVALVGVIQGIFIAVILALVVFVWRAWRPYDAVLGHVDGLKSYHDITRYPDARRIPGLVLFRWDAPLFFANAGAFHDHILRAVASAPSRTKWVVVAAEPVTDVDISAADVLIDLDADLHQEGIELCFAEMKDPVKDCLKRYGLLARLGSENFFPTIEQAVERYLEVQQMPWPNWDEGQGCG